MKRAFLSVLPSVLLLFPLLARTGGWISYGPFSKAADAIVASNNAKSKNNALTALNKQLASAKRFLAGVQTGSDDNVVLAVWNPSSNQMDSVRIDKKTFLTKGAEGMFTTGNNQLVQVRIIRANGVNTSVAITGVTGTQLTPLVVKYPITRPGKATEMAYYTSFHPALDSGDVIKEGQDYVNDALGSAFQDLTSTGLRISPDVVKVAEHLAFVEHTDHKRFKTENHPELFKEISGLYALNSGDTFRYSVSTAGAGGMIQMIPKTYQAIRAKYPAANLDPDFVAGMQNHANATKAMLLYIQDTWNVLSRQDTIREALQSKLATQPELLAAGYNSNPMKLSSYIKKGGDQWRSLIPDETKMYLQIYSAVDGYFGSESE